jgi:hypothetical protein
LGQPGALGALLILDARERKPFRDTLGALICLESTWSGLTADATETGGVTCRKPLTAL